MKKIILLILLFSFLNIEAQEISQFLQNNMLTPNGATFAKYGDYPVSTYTGVIDITVPIYTINVEENFNIPIYLSYNTSGIKVYEESGRVGLGWTLNTGGLIYQSINKFNDFKSTYTVPYLNSLHTYNKTIDLLNISQIIKNDVYPCANVPFVKNGVTPSALKDSLHYLIVPWSSYSTNPDVFHYNFVGKQGRFSYLHTGEIFKEQLDDNVKITNNAEYNETPTEWTLTDAQGVVYKFAQSEKSSHILGPTNPLDNYEPVTWYLTQVKTTHNKTIEFKYKTLLDITYRFGALTQHTDQNLNIQTSGYKIFHQNVAYIDSIKFEGGHMCFIYNDPIIDKRNDLINELKLQEIIVYNVQGDLIKKIKFNYGYFESNLTDNQMINLNMLTNYYPNLTQSEIIDLLKYRLKLTRVDVLSDETNNKESYAFKYKETDLPGKLSTARDHWGYYNGKKSNLNILPTFTKHHGEVDGYTVIESMTYSNREPDPNYNQAFILDEISYPTGGKSLFEYESNTYDPSLFGLDPSRVDYYYKEKSANILENANNGLRNATINTSEFTIYNSDMTSNSSTTKVVVDASVVLPTPLTYFQTGSGLINPIVRIINLANNQILYEYNYGNFVPDPTDEQKYHLLTQEINLYAGYYAIQTTGDNKSLLEEFRANVSWTSTPSTFFYENPECYGGGLRIKRIKNVDHDKTTSIKRYNYQDGKLLFYPRYQYKVPLVGGWPYITSSGFGTSSFSVGYSEIEEITADTLTDILKSKESFFNEPNVYIPFSSVNYLTPSPSGTYITTFDLIPDDVNSNLNDPRNGTLVCKEDSILRNNIFYLHKKSINHIDFNCRDRLWGLDNIFKAGADPTSTVVMGCEDNLVNHYYAHIYPVMDRVWLKVNSSTEEIYTSDGSHLSTENIYEYNTVNKKISSMTTTRSDGKSKISTIKYIDDLVSSPIKDTLIAQNRIEQIVNERVKINDNIVSGTNYSFDFFSTLSNYPWISKIENLNGSAVKNYIQFLTYDSKGNPTSVLSSDNKTVVVIWGYNFLYPIAEIENISLTEVLNALQGVTLEQLSSAAVPDMQKVEDLRYVPSLSKAMITTYTYKPLVGMTSKTDPRGITTYYQYDDFGRLKATYIGEKDANGNEVRKLVTGSFDYHYRE